MFELIIMTICISFNAILSFVEMAFVSVGKGQLRALANSGNKEAGRVLKLRDNPERTLSVLQIGITLVGAVAAATGGAGAEESINPYLESLGMGEGGAEFLGVILIVIPFTYLSVVLGELVPKTLALRNPVRIILRASRWLDYADRMLQPIVSFLEWSTKKFMAVFFRRAKFTQESTTSETLALDHLSPQHRQYVFNLINIEQKRIQDVMLPWNQVVGIDVSHSLPEVAAIILESGHTRIPVLDGDRVVGILHAKEFMVFQSCGQENWQSIVREPIFVQARDSLLRIFKAMQEKRHRLSIVLSGDQIVGIVTIEDILEEITGDLFDEDDDGAMKRLLGSHSALRFTRFRQK